MNELKIIDQREVLGKDFRIYGTAENPLFLAKDVANWIEHSDRNKMLQTVDEDEKLLGTLFLSGQNRQVWFLTEDGLYEVLMQSRKPVAKEFKKQVKEILRSIRKNGGYIAGQESLSDTELMARALIVAKNALQQQDEKITELQTENSTLTVENLIMRPKAEYFDGMVDRNLLTSLRETAKELGVKEKEFVKFLLNNKYLYRDKKGKLMPYAEKNDGLFVVKECYNEKTGWSGTQTLVTPKGRETFRLLCEGMG